MKKIDTLKDYYAGTKAYNLFLLDLFANKNTYGNLILDKKNQMAAKVGFISNILLSIKEDIISKEKNGDFNSKIMESELESMVKYIAIETDKGFKVGNYIFKSKEELVGEIRNKIGHGNFIFDLDHNRILIHREEKYIPINIDNLTNFVVEGLKYTLKNSNGNIYNRNFLVSNKIDNNRNKPFSSVNDLKQFVKSFTQYEFTLIDTNGNKIKDSAIVMMENVINKFKTNQLTNVIDGYKKVLPENCQFLYNKNKLPEDVLEDICNDLFKFLNPDDKYNDQVDIICNELPRYFNNSYNTFKPLLSNLTNLMVIDGISKSNSINVDEIKEYIDSNIVVNFDNLISSSISMFNALFSYGINSIYKNKNKFTDLVNTGLKYEELDVSMFNINKLEIDIDYLNQLYNDTNFKQINYKKYMDLIFKANKCLVNVKEKGNKPAIKKIQNTISSLEESRDAEYKKYNESSNMLNVASEYYLSNTEYLTNERLIEGIRNSISHGNYEVILGESFTKTNIHFMDIFEGKTTMDVNISASNFMNFMNINFGCVIEYLNNKSKIEESLIKIRKKQG